MLSAPASVRSIGEASPSTKLSETSPRPASQSAQCRAMFGFRSVASQSSARTTRRPYSRLANNSRSTLQASSSIDGQKYSSRSFRPAMMACTAPAVTSKLCPCDRVRTASASASRRRIGIHSESSRTACASFAVVSADMARSLAITDCLTLISEKCQSKRAIINIRRSEYQTLTMDLRYFWSGDHDASEPKFRNRAACLAVPAMMMAIIG